MNKKIVLLLSLLWFILFANGLIAYSESKLIYTLFSFAFLLLLISALYKTIAYSYLFLVVLLWFGIWLKLTIHLIFDYSYIEPIGSFYTSNTSMDDVLIVAMTGSFGVLLANLFYRLFKLKSTINLYKNGGRPPVFFNWYEQHKLYVFTVILIITIVVSISNVIFGIQVTGIVPKTILLYPLNALIYWMVAMGFTLLIATLISWDVRFKKELSMKDLVFYVFVAAIASVGILSRGQYVFMVGSLIVFLLLHYQLYKNFNLLKVAFFILFAGFVYFFVIYSTTTLREYYYSGEMISGGSILGGSILGGAISRTFHTFCGLLVDRWVGLEGLMSVTSYPDKNIEFFYTALTTPSKIGHIDIYQYISNAHYKDMDQTKYAFATIPGAMAFLYYSGSMWFVFIGMLLLSGITLFIEYIVYVWLRSSLLAAIIGIYLANGVAQFGLTPINLLKSLFLVFSFFAFIEFIKSTHLETLYLRLEKKLK